MWAKLYLVLAVKRGACSLSSSVNIVVRDSGTEEITQNICASILGKHLIAVISVGNHLKETCL